MVKAFKIGIGKEKKRISLVFRNTYPGSGSIQEDIRAYNLRHGRSKSIETTMTLWVTNYYENGCISG